MNQGTFSDYHINGSNRNKDLLVSALCKKDEIGPSWDGVFMNTVPTIDDYYGQSYIGSRLSKN